MNHEAYDSMGIDIRENDSLDIANNKNLTISQQRPLTKETLRAYLDAWWVAKGSEVGSVPSKIMVTQEQYDALEIDTATFRGIPIVIVGKKGTK